MKLTSDQLWQRIEDLDWAGLNKGKEFDYADRQKYGFDQYGTLGMKTLRAFAVARKNELFHAMREYEKKHGLLDTGCSDDGLSDLLWHVVGLGKFIFEQNLKNPKLLEERYRIHGYKESFGYVFLKPEPPKSKRQQRIDTLNLIIKRQSDLRNLVRDAERLSLEIERLVINLTAEIQGE